MSTTSDSGTPIGTIWRLALSAAPHPIEPRRPAIFRPLGLEAEAELARAMRLPDPAEVRRRFAGGRQCYTAWVDDTLAAYGWVSRDQESVGELGLRLRLRPDEAYIWDCATRPAFQRQGLYAALLGHICLALRAAGLRDAWIGADYANQPSQAGFARAGFTAQADLVLGPAAPGERRRRAWLQARPGISAQQVADARRVYLNERDEVWLFADEG